MLTPWKESYDQPRQHIKKQRHYFVNKGPSSQGYGCESWTIKKAEHQRIDAFELWCWRRLLRVPWTARRSNQIILKEISAECSLEGLMLKLKCQYFGHLMRRPDSFEKTLVMGKIEGRRRRGRQRMRWLDGITNSMDSGSWWWTGRPGVLQSLRSQRVGHDWATELNWNLYVLTEKKYVVNYFLLIANCGKIFHFCFKNIYRMSIANLWNYTQQTFNSQTWRRTVLNNIISLSQEVLFQLRLHGWEGTS